MNKICTICESFKDKDIPFHVLRVIMAHVDTHISYEMFDDMLKVNIFYEKLVRHIIRNFEWKTIISKKELMSQYLKYLKYNE